MKNGFSGPVGDTLAVREGFSLATFRTDATPGFPGGEAEAAELLDKMGKRVAELQEKLFAQGREGGTKAVLLVLQGMDTAGKGGIVRHVIGAVDPQGVRHRSFGVPTAQERAHHYLWRIRNSLPTPGQIGVFDRSHYEDVLVVRVNHLVEGEPWAKRYAEINRFEAGIAASGTLIIKCALLVSPEEQLRRLAERLERPDKYWKYNPNDLNERAKWPDYMDAYQAALDATSTDVAPWHAIPADNKWYARLAVMGLLLEALESLDLEWPPAQFDVEAEKQRLAAMGAPVVESAPPELKQLGKEPKKLRKEPKQAPAKKSDKAARASAEGEAASKAASTSKKPKKDSKRKKLKK